MSSTQIIQIDQIRTDPGTQIRVKIDWPTVTEYTEAIEENGRTWPFPPVVAFQDGPGLPMWLADGYHRIAAGRRALLGEIPVIVNKGTRRDAILYAAGANADHGLKRTTADKYNAVRVLISDPDWCQWSDREIGRQCRVSHPFVAKVRQEITGQDGQQDGRKYTTKHGETAVMAPKNGAGGVGGSPAAYLPPLPEMPTGSAADQLVYDWLAAYVDDMGRTWRDLQPTQIHHANSPCYQAYIKAFPDFTDPKLHLKRAMYQLQREANETPAPSPEMAIPAEETAAPGPGAMAVIDRIDQELAADYDQTLGGGAAVDPQPPGPDFKTVYESIRLLALQMAATADNIDPDTTSFHFPFKNWVVDIRRADYENPLDPDLAEAMAAVGLALQNTTGPQRRRAATILKLAATGETEEVGEMITAVGRFLNTYIPKEM